MTVVLYTWPRPLACLAARVLMNHSAGKHDRGLIYVTPPTRLFSSKGINESQCWKAWPWSYIRDPPLACLAARVLMNHSAGKHDRGLIYVTLACLAARVLMNHSAGKHDRGLIYVTPPTRLFSSKGINESQCSKAWPWSYIRDPAHSPV